MAKLRKGGAVAPDKVEKPEEVESGGVAVADPIPVDTVPVETAPVEATGTPDVGVLTMPETEVTEQPVQQPGVVPQEAAIPFTVQVPGQPAAGGEGSRGNLVQRRQDQIATALQNKTFKFKELRPGQQFFCICGAEGKNAIVLEATDTVTGEVSEVLVGSSCLKHTGVTVPKQPRRGGTLAPGISKQQKFSEALSKYTAPFRFVRKQDGPFSCLCGGRGVNQIVIADTNGTEFSVGNTCAEIIPGVVVPKQQREARKGMPAVAGLKGGVQPPPTFQNVT